MINSISVCQRVIYEYKTKMSFLQIIDEELSGVKDSLKEAENCVKGHSIFPEIFHSKIDLFEVLFKIRIVY